ncbi:MAG: OmpA family protein [Proteobacteria bacterium]|nr:OmpA family protein [Pseudomonadota bacterium]MDA1059671.1 OmpA family protein [Pseudomonadota bacterium]
MIQRQNRIELSKINAWGRIGLIVLLAGALSACSSVPNWANPANLYDRVAGVFTSDGDAEAFPTVSDVPDRPTTSTAEQRTQTAQGLVADRENARYTDDEIRRDDTAQVAAAAPAPQPVPAPRPAPPPRAIQQETAAPAPAPAAQIAQAPARPSILEERRVTPQSAPARAAAADSLDSRRTITSGRATPPQPAEPRRVAPQIVERRAPPAVPVPAAPLAMPPAAVAAVAAPVAPSPAMVLPAQPTVAVLPGQTVVSQTFALMLQDSASTVSTAPANAGFNASSAAPIQDGERPVSSIVRDTYNAALVATDRTLGPATSAVQSVAFQGQGLAESSAAVVQFGHDSARLPNAAQATVRAIAEQYKARGGVVRVVGHASSKTKNMAVAEHNLTNFKISLDRAQAVANALIRLGVPPEAIFVEARGAADPAFFESMPAGEAGNRRAEIFLDFSTS